MLRIYSVFILLSFYSLAFGQDVELYSIIDLELDRHEDIGILLDLGIAADHVHYHGDGPLELFVSQREKDILIDNGFIFTDQIPNTKLYAEKLADINKKKFKSTECGLNSFTLGSIEGYHDYAEVVTILNHLNEAYPKLTQLTTLGQSYEQRDILALKISDNASLDESNTEPAAYYDALTHAREPLSMMSTLYYIYWLLENYDNPNELAKFYIDSRELHFILVVNPDGYVYNTVTAPNGGGGWRKNRKPINDYCIGVDLNRNFNAQWDGPGSHGIEPCFDTYRGESPSSEIETQLIQNYLDQTKPKSAFSSHSFSQVILDPNKKVNNPDYDFAQYAGYASEFTPMEYFGYGSADDLIGYLASGTTLDYLSEIGTIAWTPEIGTIFWEPAEDICGYAQEMLEPMKFISKIAGVAPSYHYHYVANDDKIINGNTIELSVDINNKGLLEDSEPVSVELISLSPTVTVQNNLVEYSAPNEGNKFYNAAEKFRLDLSNMENGIPIPLQIRVSKNNILVDIKEISIFPGEFNVLFEDDFESGINKWIQSSNQETWSITHIDSKSGQRCLIDSRRNYQPDLVSVIQFANPIDLTDVENPWLFFNIKYGLNPRAAILRVLISSDEINWRAIKTNGMGVITDSNSFTGNSYWNQEFVNLSSLVNGDEKLYLRFELSSLNSNNTSDGVYIDDVKVLNFSEANNTTSTENTKKNIKLKVYPNPASDIIYVTIANNREEAMNISIFNSLGQKVKSVYGVNSAKRVKINLNQLPNGPYFLQLQSRGSTINKKIFKN